jgi:serine/threonine protein kinase/WD40 repeat protein/tetratricopeptide (TPR) repeat protein
MSEPESDRDREQGADPAPSSARDPLGPVVESFLARLRSGERPSLTEFIERYPELAGEIRELLPAMVEMEQLGSLGGASVKAAAGVSKVIASATDAGNAATGALSAEGEGPNFFPWRLGDYRIIRAIGEGGMGVVYEAVRESLRSHVALKVMHPRFRASASYLRRFHNEARSAAQLHHTNIVSVFDYGEHEGVCYYAMQYIAGHSLDTVLNDVRRLRRSQHQEEVLPAQARADTESRLSLGERRPLRGAKGDTDLRGAKGDTDLRGAKGDTGLRGAKGDNDLRGTKGDNGPAGGEAPTDPLMRTVTHGLLTGQFALGAGEPEPTLAPPGTTERVPLAESGQPVATADLGFELGRIPAPAPQVTARGEDPSPADSALGTSSSSLATHGQDRYHREVARLGAQVADALAYAHKRGVLHRDIKPSNLLLDAAGNIWVTDFGLAKFEEGEDLSQSQDLVGTLRYMAPERFRGVSDRRCDIYALGATLYELLTLRPTFETHDRLRLIDQIVHEPPAPPRQLDRRIPRDLETILLKALAKDPKDRFATADELAAELRRFLENRPIRSRPIPSYERFWRWCKRNPALAALNAVAASLTTFIAIGATVSAWTFRDQRDQIAGQRDDIRRAETSVRERLFESLTSQARGLRLSRRMGQRFESLRVLGQAAAIGRALGLPRERFETLRDEAIACLTLPDLKAVGPVADKHAPNPVVVFDASMSRCAQAYHDMVQVRGVADDHEIVRLPPLGKGDDPILRFSPDGRYLATNQDPNYALKVWDIQHRAPAVNEPGPVHWNLCSFSLDSRRIAVGRGDGQILVYDLATGECDRPWDGTSLRGLSFRPEGGQIAVVQHDEKNSICSVVDAVSGRLVHSFPLPSRPFEDVAWSPDLNTLAIACSDRKIYLWDVATGARRATVDNPGIGGLRFTFHPAGTLLASNSWERVLRLWDPILGHSVLNLAGERGPGISPEFSQDGRIVLLQEDKVVTYQVEPALEYRTLADVRSRLIGQSHVSIHRNGRLMAVGTSQGVVLWDMLRGTELAFLPIGLANFQMFEASGSLLTSGLMGVQRWRVDLNTGRGTCRIGPPAPLALPAGTEDLDEDQSGRIVALAYHDRTFVSTPERAFELGPLDDVRGVAVSPDGQWLATGSHSGVGVQIWRVRDSTLVTNLAISEIGRVAFSPDGKWLMTKERPCRLWPVGTWRQARRIGGYGRCFSPDGRMLVVEDANHVIRLVEAATGRTLARLESPDLCSVGEATFSADGSRLAVVTGDGPALHIWDLKAIRRQLMEMGLDWDAPPLADPEGGTEGGAHRLPLTLEVDYGSLKDQVEQRLSHLEQYTIPADELVSRYTERLRTHPDDGESLHKRGHALSRLNRPEEALTDFSAALARHPLDAHLRAYQGLCLFDLQRHDQALDQLEEAFRAEPAAVRAIAPLSQEMNNVAWKLATGPAPERNAALAVRLARFSVALSPGEQVSLNTLGVALYRAGQYSEAVSYLERSLAVGKGGYDAFDLFFLAVAHHRLGHRAEARACFDRAVRWWDGHKNLEARYVGELTSFRAEAEALLSGATGELPANVFARE